MDALAFDAYTSYSDSSTPRTPSPPSYPLQFNKNIDPLRNIFSDHPNEDPLSHPTDQPFWNSMHSPPFSFNHNKGSLLQELYEHDLPDQPLTHEVYLEHSAEPPFSGSSDWSPQQHHQIQHQQQQQHQQHQHQQHHQQVTQRPADYSLMRRATFPYVRHDREEQFPQFVPQDGPSYHYSRGDGLYVEQLPLSADPSTLHGSPYSMSSSPHSSYREFDHLEDPHHPHHHSNASIKLEDNPPVIVPSQTAFYRTNTAQQQQQHQPLAMPYLSPQTGLPVQHTDDAASKETQYLRRRCFNCHTTEPPSWRRSTLNPGKIVCNKCGLYERTHLRPRPLRFDELRAGNKARKQSVGGVNGVGPVPGKGNVSPKGRGVLVKKEPRDYNGIVRRSSVSSSASSSVSGASDWDDSVSVYSAGSAPPTSFNSPDMPNYPMPLRDSSSRSPPLHSARDGGIRLPNAPLSDIASLQHQQMQQQMHQHQQQQQMQSPPSHPQSPRKSQTLPSPFYPSSSSSNGSTTSPGLLGSPALISSPLHIGSPPLSAASTASPTPMSAASAAATNLAQDLYRRGSLPDMQALQAQRGPVETTGWQSVGGEKEGAGMIARATAVVS